MHSLVRLLMRGIKNGHLIGQRNDITANMAALAVCRCLAQPSLRHSAPQVGSPGRDAHLRRSLLLFSGGSELLWLLVCGYFNYLCFIIRVL